MRTEWLAVAAAVVIAGGVLPAAGGQEPDPTEPTVPLVKAVGCVEKDGDAWFLSRATDPEVTRYPFPSAVEARGRGPRGARLQAPGAVRGHRFSRRGGVAGVVPAGRAYGARRRSTRPERIAAGRKVAVKGLYITSVEPHRVNLTSAMAVADTCG